MELTTYYLVFCNFLYFEGNKPDCRKFLEWHGWNKKAKKSKQTNNKIYWLPGMLFCDYYFIQSICNIFISTGGCFPHFAPFHAMKHYQSEQLQYNMASLPPFFPLYILVTNQVCPCWNVIPNWVTKMKKRIQTFKIIDFRCNQIKWTTKENKIKG